MISFINSSPAFKPFKGNIGMEQVDELVMADGSVTVTSIAVTAATDDDDNYDGDNDDDNDGGK